MPQDHSHTMQTLPLQAPTGSRHLHSTFRRLKLVKTCNKPAEGAVHALQIGIKIQPLRLVLGAGHPARHALVACPGAPAGQQRGRVNFGRLLLGLAALGLVELCLHIIPSKCSGYELPLAKL